MATVRPGVSRCLVPGSAVCTLAFLVASSPPAHSAEWEFQPEVSFATGVDDNVELAADSAGTAYSGSAVAGVTLRRFTETLEVRASGNVGYTNYLAGSDDPEDTNFQILQLDSAYKTERSTWRLDGSLRRDTTFEDVEEREGDIDPGADIDRGLVEQSVRRHRLIAIPSFQHDVTERLAAGLRYRWHGLYYEDREDVDVMDSVTHQAESTAMYRLSERHTVGLGVEAQLFRPEDSQDDVDTYSLLAMSDYRATERSTLSVSGGVRHSNFSGDDDQRSATGPVGGVSGRTRGENWTASVAIERRLRPSGEGQLRETDQVILRLSRDLSPRTTISLRGRAYETRSPSDGDANDDRLFVDVSPSIRYRLTPTWSLLGEYRYQWLDEEDVSGTAQSNAAFIGIEYEALSQAPNL